MKYINLLKIKTIEDYFSFNLKDIKINNYYISHDISKRKLSKYREKILNDHLLLETILNQNGSKIIDMNLSEEEILKINSPFLTYYYCGYVINGSWEKGEDIIMQNPRYSYYYVTSILQEPWRKGESVIMNSDYAYNYIQFFKIKEQMFPKG